MIWSTWLCVNIHVAGRCPNAVCSKCKHRIFVIYKRGTDRPAKVLATRKTKPYTKWEVAMLQMGVEIEDVLG